MVWSRAHNPSLRRPALALVGLLATVLIGDRVLNTVISGVLERGADFPVWLPHFSSVGETVLFYTLLFDVLKFVAVPATLLWLAYAYGWHRATQ